MSESNFAKNSDWVRLNVGGKTFQTTKDTLSRHPDTFFARLINGKLPSEKDEFGAYLVDGDPEHFRTILTYLRRGVLNMDDNEKTAKDLLCEADFYNVQPLVDEIRKAMRSKANTTEMITMWEANFGDRCTGTCVFSETEDDYKVLQVLRDRIRQKFVLVNTGEYNIDAFKVGDPLRIETILRGLGFVLESQDDKFYKCDAYTAKCWKFVRSISK